MSHEIEALARGVGSERGTGGMASKLKAVKMVTSSGEAAIVADGREKDILGKLFAGDQVGTFFHPQGGRMRGRKRWIAFFIKPKGKIVVDDGAAAAVRLIRELLASSPTTAPPVRRSAATPT